MKISCHCSSCGAEFEVGEELAGRKAKCPMCSQPVILARAAAPRKPRAAAEASKPVLVSTPPAGGLPQIDAGSPASGRGGSRRAPPAVATGRRGNRGLQLAVAGGLLALLVAMGVVLGLVVLSSPQGPQETASQQSQSATADDSSPAPKDLIPTLKGPRSAENRNSAVLTVDWAEDERSGAAVFIDNKKAELPGSGPVKYELSPGRHRVELRRRKYEPLEFVHSFKPGEVHDYRPAWTLVPTIDDVLPPKEFDEWIARFKAAEETPDEAAKVIQEFNGWMQSYEFKDKGLAARLHLEAAYVLYRTGHHELLASQCEQGLACNPQNPETLYWLRMLHQVGSQARGGGVKIVGSGTGFCVAAGGYCLTNHHVIAAGRSARVLLYQQKTPLAATAVATDPKADMALLKVQLPGGEELKPLALAEPRAQLGQQICILGYPFTGTNNNTLKVIQGIVSSLPAVPEAGMIEINSPVNPGNSGGPMFSTHGTVLGMVTEKVFFADRAIDSLGRVIPVARLKPFLVKNLPESQRNLVVGKAASELKPAEVVQSFAPSVVMVLAIR